MKAHGDLESLVQGSKIYKIIIQGKGSCVVFDVCYIATPTSRTGMLLNIYFSDPSPYIRQPKLEFQGYFHAI